MDAVLLDTRVKSIQGNRGVEAPIISIAVVRTPRLRVRQD